MSEFDFAAEYAAFGEELKGVAYSGDYTMKVQKVVAGTSPKGKQMFTVTLAFTDGPLAAKGKTINDKLYWSPESDTAARIFSQNLKIMGASQDWIMANRPTPAQIAEQMTGSVIDVKLKADEFNGQPQTRVNYNKTVSAKSASGASAPSAAAAAAVSLDDEDAAPAAPAAAPAATDEAVAAGSPWS